MGRVTGFCNESARRQRSSVQPHLGWTESFPLSKRPDSFYGVMFYAAVKAYQSFKCEKSVAKRIGKKEHGPQEYSRKGVDRPKIRHYAEDRSTESR